MLSGSLTSMCLFSLQTYLNVTSQKPVVLQKELKYWGELTLPFFQIIPSTQTDEWKSSLLIW
jgi:hypothetical protein